MTEIGTQASLWLGLALIASLLSLWLCIATWADIKTGSLCRSERIAKDNRLLEIEAELGAAARIGA